MNVRIIRVDGSEEDHTVERKDASHTIMKLMGCEWIEVVRLNDGYVMWVDDRGYISTPVQRGDAHFEFVPLAPRKPFNDKATALYHSVCEPGTTHRIVGDVAIVFDEDFAPA